MRPRRRPADRIPAPESLELQRDHGGDELGERARRDTRDGAGAAGDDDVAVVALQLHVEVDRDRVAPEDLITQIAEERSTRQSGLTRGIRGEVAGCGASARSEVVGRVRGGTGEVERGKLDRARAEVNQVDRHLVVAIEVREDLAA